MKEKEFLGSYSVSCIRAGKSASQLDFDNMVQKADLIKFKYFNDNNFSAKIPKF